VKPGDYVVATVRRPGSSIYDLIGTNDMTSLSRDTTGFMPWYFNFTLEMEGTSPEDTTGFMPCGTSISP